MKGKNMRLRNIPGADDFIQGHSAVIKNEKEQKGKWGQVFSNNHPIHIEIGMGKGQFLMTLAKQNPHINTNMWIYVYIYKIIYYIFALEKRGGFWNQLAKPL